MDADGGVVGIGSLGLGGFGRQHLAAWAAVPEARVVAVADQRPETLKEIGDRYGVSTQYAGLDELLADPRVDAIDIVTPPEAHVEHALAAIAAGKHVFVEKPLAESTADAQRVVDAARAAGVRLQVGLVSRFGVPYGLIKDQLDAGAFGDLVTIRAKRNIPQAWATHFQQAHPVYETAIHDLDLIVWYAGPRCLTAYAQHRRHLGLRHPDTFMALLGFESGVLVEVESTWHVPAGAPTGIMGAWDVGGIIDAELEVIGTRQTAKFSLADPGLTLWGSRTSFQPEIHLFPTLHGQTGGAIRDELRHFVATVRSGQDSLVAPAQDAVATLRIADAILRSAETGQVVRLEP